MKKQLCQLVLAATLSTGCSQDIHPSQATLDILRHNIKDDISYVIGHTKHTQSHAEHLEQAVEFLLRELPSFSEQSQQHYQRMFETKQHAGYILVPHTFNAYGVFSARSPNILINVDSIIQHNQPHRYDIQIALVVIHELVHGYLSYGAQNRSRPLEEDAAILAEYRMLVDHPSGKLMQLFMYGAESQLGATVRSYIPRFSTTPQYATLVGEMSDLLIIREAVYRNNQRVLNNYNLPNISMQEVEQKILDTQEMFFHLTTNTQ